MARARSAKGRLRSTAVSTSMVSENCPIASMARGCRGSRLATVVLSVNRGPAPQVASVSA
ncbi:hypothetical protein GCM10020000_38490 [Streptomyces olivoverticillatus]